LSPYSARISSVQYISFANENTAVVDFIRISNGDNYSHPSPAASQKLSVRDTPRIATPVLPSDVA